MVDSLGYRMKFGVIAPSTNTSVQPEFDSMRPVGVTNHFSRIIIPDDPVHSDEDFNELVMRIRADGDGMARERGDLERQGILTVCVHGVLDFDRVH